MSKRVVNLSKLKSKRKKNQYINELIKSHYPHLMISKREFKRRHKNEVIQMFELYGYDVVTEGFITDLLVGYYWYRDPLCYKTELYNSNLLEFDEKFDEIFGRDIKYNQLFLKKIKRINNFYMNF